MTDEIGRLVKEAPLRVCLAYPSPYHVGMSSLGFQRIYRALLEAPGMCCERAFLADDATDTDQVETVVTYESLTPIGNFSIVALSVAYELELAGLIRLLTAAGIPPLREDRTAQHPFILAGGPLTFSNPLPLDPYVDALIMGEAEALMPIVCQVIDEAPSRAAALATLAAMPHIYVPTHHDEQLPTVAKVDDALLPAWAPIRTPHTELANMFLIETERGCSRRCAYCVMRRSTNGGMRLVPKETILGLVPADARRVGLVGAAVSDHPKIVEIVRTLTEQGRGVGLSSLRPDRLSDEFVGALKGAGYRTLTTAMDGPSERLREALGRHARQKHLLSAAERARAHGMDRLKLYLMIGLPDETADDIDECVRFTTELTRIVPVALGIAPFCAKRNTPLDRQPFAGMKVVEDRLDRLRRGLRGRADVRATSARWAWVEYVLAQGGAAEGRAVLDAVRAGGSFAAYKRAFGTLAATATTTRPERIRSLPMMGSAPQLSSLTLWFVRGYDSAMKPTLLVQVIFLLLASLGVYTFLVSARDGESRSACSALCALRPTYANQDRRAPEFTLPDLNGRPVAFQSYRGKTVVLNFWSKTCRPCLEEMPSLAELTKLWQNETDKVVVTISTDPTAEDARSTLRAVLGQDPPFAVLIDPASHVVGDLFGTKLYPETWLIDPSGVIRLRMDGARDWSNSLVLDVARMVARPNGCPVTFLEGKPQDHGGVCEM